MKRAGVEQVEPTRTDGPFVSRAPKLGYFPPFDGVRGGAMIMVLLAHLSYSQFASFAASVDMFFVISGFLITTLLLEEHRKTDRVDMGEFYWRRAFRLFPMLYATLAATVLGALATGKAQLFKEAWQDALAAGLYVYHVVHPVGIEINTSQFPHHRPLVQLWSLSVEEHFYLVAAVLTVVVVRHRLPKVLIAVFMGIWLFVGVARLTGHVGPRLMWYQRPDSLLVGVCVAYLHALMPPELSARAARLLRALGLLALGVIVVVVFIGTGLAPLRIRFQFSPFDGTSQLRDGWYWGRFGFSMVNISLGVLLLAMVRNGEWIVSRFMSWRPLREVGIRSYCIYLIHVPLAVIMFEQWGERDSKGEFKPDPVLFLSYLVALVVLTQLSHKYLEQPLMRKGKELRSRQKAAAS